MRTIFKYTIDGLEAYIDVNKISSISEQEDGSYYVYLDSSTEFAFIVPYTPAQELLEIWENS